MTTKFEVEGFPGLIRTIQEGEEVDDFSDETDEEVEVSLHMICCYFTPLAD